MPVIERGCVVCFSIERGRTAEHAMLSLLLMQASGRSYEDIHRGLCFTHRRVIDKGLTLATTLTP